MASDGDLFQQRRAWGFAKAYTVACAGGPLEAEAAAVARATRNALNGDFRMPSLGPLLAAATDALAQHFSSLFSNDLIEGKRTLRERLAAVERGYADFPSSHDVRAVVERLACEAIEDGSILAGELFRHTSYERLGRWLVDRLHFKPTEIDVRKSQHLERNAAMAREIAVFEKCSHAITVMLAEVAASSTGRPAKLKPHDGPDVNSVEGLNESLILAAP
jgi:hypothetical protein